MKRGVVLALVIGLGNLGGFVFHLTELLGGRGYSQLDSYTAGSVLHSSTINHHVFIRATAQ